MEGESSRFLATLLLSGVVIAWLFDGWLVMLRVALVRLGWMDVADLRRMDSPRAEQALALLHQRATLGWVVQSGLLLAHLVVGAGGLSLAWLMQWPTRAALALLLALGMALLLWEWGLTRWVRARRVEWALRLTSSGAWIVRLVLPLSKRLGFVEEDAEALLSEEALEALVRASVPEEVEERQMLVSIARFGDTLVREVMVPRIDMVALEVNASLEEAREAFIQSGFSRLPVYRDTVDNIVGLLYAKDLLRVWHEGRSVTSLEPLLRPAYFVPEAKKVDELLTEMQSRHIHMAIVVDEYGGVAGLVTLEDIVEEIVGEIQDEYDRPVEALYRQIGEDEYLLSGRMDLDDFNRLMHTHLNTEEEEADTLGGLIYTRIGQVPQGGEQVRVEDVVLTVEKVDGRRIAWVRARRIPTAEGENHAHA